MGKGPGAGSSPGGDYVGEYGKVVQKDGKKRGSQTIGGTGTRNSFKNAVMVRQPTRQRGNQSHSVFLLGAEGGARIVEPGRIVTVVRFSGGMEVKGYG